MVVRLFNAVTKALHYRQCKLFTAYPPESHIAYAKYIDAFNLTARYRDIFGTGGNGSGKSYWLCTLFAYIITGVYPDWWGGRRYNRNLHIAIGSNTVPKTRDLLQFRLFGDPSIPGDLGFIPPDMIIGLPQTIVNGKGAWSRVVVKQPFSGFHTIVEFFSHQQGQMALQGMEYDIVGIDEIPQDHSTTTELFSRTRAANKPQDTMFIMVGTALDKVPFETINMYYLKPNKTRGNFQFNTWDAPHLPADEKLRMASMYSDSDQQTRMLGYPAIGANRVFPFTKEQILTPPLNKVPNHWFIKNGYDEGRHAGIVCNALDPEVKTEYIITTRLTENYRTEEILKLMYELNSAPYICDTSLKKTDAHTRKPVFLKYQQAGFDILFPKNKKMKRYYMDNMRMKYQEGRLKIWDTPENEGFVAELLMYSTDEDGSFVKMNDHRIDAHQYEQQYTHKEVSKTWFDASQKKPGVLPPYMDITPLYDSEHERWTRQEPTAKKKVNLTW